MPTYLCHGFRWHRQAIRIFVGYHDLMDAAPDWIIAPATSSVILHRLHELYPFIPGALAELDAEVKAETVAETVPETDTETETTLGAMDGQSSAVSLLEEHDPDETQVATRPHAYVADYVVKVDLGVSVTAEIARYEEDKRRERVPEGEVPWFEKLRDGMQGDEAIQWYVVVCGDEERHVPGLDQEQREQWAT